MAESNGGYIRLYRKLLNDPIWTQLMPSVLKVAIYFIFRANYKAAQWYDGSETIEIPVGSFITSYAKTASVCGLSLQQTRDAFAHLERTHFTTYRRTPRWTLVTVTNYATYQSVSDEENIAPNTPDTGQRTPRERIKNRRTEKCASPSVDAHAPDCRPTTGSTSGEQRTRSAQSATDRGARELRKRQAAWFSQWWEVYWRKRDKKRAWLAFGRHVRTQTRFDEVMKATRAQTAEMMGKEERFRPHGASWLNGERWQDETMPQANASATDDYPEL